MHTFVCYQVQWQSTFIQKKEDRLRHVIVNDAPMYRSVFFFHAQFSSAQRTDSTSTTDTSCCRHRGRRYSDSMALKNLNELPMRAYYHMLFSKVTAASKLVL